MLEKGDALITALESALQTGTGFHWNDAEVTFLMRRVGTSKDIHALALVDEEGKVILGAGEAAQGSTFATDLSEVNTLRGEVITRGKKPHFRVSRRIFLSSASEDEHNRHRHDTSDTSTLLTERISRPLWLIADYDMEAIAVAQKAERQHMLVLAGILILLSFLGWISAYLARSYMRSRRLAQESALFAAHIVRTLPAGIIATDTETCVTSINPEACRIMGITEEEALGLPLRALAPAFEEALHSILTDKKPVLDMEIRCAFGKGKALPLAVSASALLDSEESSLGYVFIARDLGEIRHLQFELRRRDRLAALGTLAAGVAHEVRNPLSAIKGIARYFEESNPSESVDAELAQTLGQEVSRLDRVVGELLDLARPDNIQRVMTPLDALIERAHRMVKPALQAGGVCLVVDLPKPPPQVAVDADRLAQVLINLFLNAIEAMCESEKRLLTVRGTIKQQAYEKILQLDVEDSGPGIPAGKLQDIFSPYFTTKSQGTGLGLSIVHKIIEAHDGIIEAKNAVGGGCIMSMHLPLPSSGE